MTIRARVPAIATLAAGLIALAATAEAAPGYVVDGVNLRAGPGLDYPVVAPLPPGTPTEIFGCLEGWTWCDIAVNGPEGGLRGWAAGPRLQLAYNGQPVGLPEYAPQFGLPIIGFDVDSYWGTYYRGEPWFGDRGRWRGDFHGGPGYGAGGYGPRGPVGPGGGFAGDPRGGYRGGGGEPGGLREGGGPGGGAPGGPRPGAGPGGPPGGFHPGGAPGPGGHGGPPAAPQGGPHAENRGGGGPDHRPPN